MLLTAAGRVAQSPGVDPAASNGVAVNTESCRAFPDIPFLIFEAMSLRYGHRDHNSPYLCLGLDRSCLPCLGTLLFAAE